MASPWAHALAGAAVGALYQGPERRRVMTLAAICAVAPDLDLIGWPLGVPFQAPLGHRGLTHSIPFAVLIGAAAAAAFLRMLPSRDRLIAGLVLVLATATHSLLDALTTYSPTGPAFWAPFSNARYRFLWTPLTGEGGFRTGFGREALYVCLPALVVILGIEWWRRGQAKRS
ncbi:MAG TPA: metal-dependent hydrolase [Gemmatimonadales bacterium]|nr:metal-dependent hydrolase [Gemmatimonadales bacterium]